jgi:transposase-like protein
MTPDAEHRRRQAVALYLAGDPIDDICRRMRGSNSWLYKWKNRYQAGDPVGAQPRSRRLRTQTAQRPPGIEQAVIPWRHTLAQAGQRQAAGAIPHALRQHGLEPVPSARTIYRILQRHDQKERFTP